MVEITGKPRRTIVKLTDNDDVLISDVPLSDLKTAQAAMVTALQLIDNAVSGNALVTFRSTATLLNSGVLSGDTQVKASPGAVYWISVSDSAALTIDLEDSSGSGTSKWGIDLPAEGYGHFIFDPPLEFGTAIYLDVDTATCKVTIGYK